MPANTIKNIIVRVLRFVHSSRLISAWKKMNDLAKLPSFASLGEGTEIMQPFYSGNAQHIRIGKGCRIGMGSDFGVIMRPGFKGGITIGDNVSITARCQIFSLIDVEIEDDVLIASNVFISDCSHGYKDGTIPFNLQPFEPYGAIKIGQGSWIGQNVVILQGIQIGKQSIIGANSIVKDSIPDNCIAVGNPARVIKKWDNTLKKWVPVKFQNI